MFNHLRRSFRPFGDTYLSFFNTLNTKTTQTRLIKASPQCITRRSKRQLTIRDHHDEHTSNNIVEKTENTPINQTIEAINPKSFTQAQNAKPAPPQNHSSTLSRQSIQSTSQPIAQTSQHQLTNPTSPFRSATNDMNTPKPKIFHNPTIIKPSQLLNLTRDANKTPHSEPHATDTLISASGIVPTSQTTPTHSPPLSKDPYFLVPTSLILCALFAITLAHGTRTIPPKVQEDVVVPSDLDGKTESFAEMQRRALLDDITQLTQSLEQHTSINPTFPQPSNHIPLPNDSMTLPLTSTTMVPPPEQRTKSADDSQPSFTKQPSRFDHQDYELPRSVLPFGVRFAALFDPTSRHYRNLTLNHGLSRVRRFSKVHKTTEKFEINIAFEYNPLDYILLHDQHPQPSIAHAHKRSPGLFGTRKGDQADIASGKKKSEKYNYSSRFNDGDETAIVVEGQKRRVDHQTAMDKPIYLNHADNNGDIDEDDSFDNSYSRNQAHEDFFQRPRYHDNNNDNNNNNNNNKNDDMINQSHHTHGFRSSSDVLKLFSLYRDHLLNVDTKRKGQQINNLTDQEFFFSSSPHSTSSYSVNPEDSIITPDSGVIPSSPLQIQQFILKNDFVSAAYLELLASYFSIYDYYHAMPYSEQLQTFRNPKMLTQFNSFYGDYYDIFLRAMYNIVLNQLLVRGEYYTAKEFKLSDIYEGYDDDWVARYNKWSELKGKVETYNINQVAEVKNRLTYTMRPYFDRAADRVINNHHGARSQHQYSPKALYNHDPPENHPISIALDQNLDLIKEYMDARKNEQGRIQRLEAEWNELHQDDPEYAHLFKSHNIYTSLANHENVNGSSHSNDLLSQIGGMINSSTHKLHKRMFQYQTLLNSGGSLTKLQSHELEQFQQFPLLSAMMLTGHDLESKQSQDQDRVEKELNEKEKSRKLRNQLLVFLSNHAFQPKARRPMIPPLEIGPDHILKRIIDIGGVPVELTAIVDAILILSPSFDLLHIPNPPSATTTSKQQNIQDHTPAQSNVALSDSLTPSPYPQISSEVLYDVVQSSETRDYLHQLLYLTYNWTLLLQSTLDHQWTTTHITDPIALVEEYKVIRLPSITDLPFILPARIPIFDPEKVMALESKDELLDADLEKFQFLVEQGNAATTLIHYPLQSRHPLLAPGEYHKEFALPSTLEEIQEFNAQSDTFFYFDFNQQTKTQAKNSNFGSLSIKIKQDSYERRLKQVFDALPFIQNLPFGHNILNFLPKPPCSPTEELITDTQPSSLATVNDLREDKQRLDALWSIIGEDTVKLTTPLQLTNINDFETNLLKLKHTLSKASSTLLKSENEVASGHKKGSNGEYIPNTLSYSKNPSLAKKAYETQTLIMPCLSPPVDLELTMNVLLLEPDATFHPQGLEVWNNRNKHLIRLGQEDFKSAYGFTPAYKYGAIMELLLDPICNPKFVLKKLEDELETSASKPSQTYQQSSMLHTLYDTSTRLPARKSSYPSEVRGFYPDSRLKGLYRRYTPAGSHTRGSGLVLSGHNHQNKISNSPHYPHVINKVGDHNDNVKGDNEDSTDDDGDPFSSNYKPKYRFTPRSVPHIRNSLDV